MLDKIVSFFISPKSDPEAYEPSASVSLNTALLMIDLAGSDHDLAAEEMNLIKTFLQKEFGLDSDDVERLINEARVALSNQTDLWEPILFLNQRLSHHDKMQLMIKLWKIVFIDGRLDGNEDHLMHKIADLLKLEHDDLIRTKLLAKEDR